MALGDSDEIAKLSAQLTALSIQLAEMRGEFTAMRRDIEHGHAERAATLSQLQQLQTQLQHSSLTSYPVHVPSEGWGLTLLIVMALLVAGSIFLAIYLGGSSGVGA